MKPIITRLQLNIKKDAIRIKCPYCSSIIGHTTCEVDTYNFYQPSQCPKCKVKLDWEKSK